MTIKQGEVRPKCDHGKKQVTKLGSYSDRHIVAPLLKTLKKIMLEKVG